MIYRIIIFIVFFASGCIGISLLEELNANITGDWFGFFEIGDKEVKLFSSLFQILYIELILLSIYFLFSKRDCFQKNESENSFFKAIENCWSNILAKSDDKKSNSTLMSTILISISISIAIQITVSISDINGKLSLDLENEAKEFITASLKDGAVELNNSVKIISTELQSIKHTISNIKPSYKGCPIIAPPSICNDYSEIEGVIKNINVNISKIPDLLKSLETSQDQAVDTIIYNKGIKDLVSGYSASSNALIEANKKVTKLVVNKLDEQLKVLSKLDDLDSLPQTKESVVQLKKLLCAEILFFPAMSRVFVSTEVLQACGIL